MLYIKANAHSQVFRQKNVPAGFSISSSYVLTTDSKTVLSLIIALRGHPQTLDTKYIYLYVEKFKKRKIIIILIT